MRPRTLTWSGIFLHLEPVDPDEGCPGNVTMTRRGVEYSGSYLMATDDGILESDTGDTYEISQSHIEWLEGYKELVWKFSLDPLNYDHQDYPDDDDEEDLL